MSALLLVAYFDLVRYGIPLVLLGNVAYIYGNIAGLGLGSLVVWQHLYLRVELSSRRGCRRLAPASTGRFFLLNSRYCCF